VVRKAPFPGTRLVVDDPSGNTTVELTQLIKKVEGLLPSNGIIASCSPANGHTCVTVPEAESYVALRLLTPSAKTIEYP